MKAAVILAIMAIALQSCTVNAVLYRAVRQTRLVAGAPIDDIIAKQKSDLAACRKWFVSAVIGKSAGALPEADWGSMVRLVDFKTTAKFSDYLKCVAAQPNAKYIASFIAGDSRGFATLTSKNKPLTRLPDNAFIHLGQYNTSDPAQNVELRTQLMSDFSGKAVIDYIPGVSSMNSQIPNNVDFSNIIVFKYPSSALGYFYFKHGDAAYKVDPNPFFSKLAPIITGGTHDIDFFFERV